MSLSQKDNLRTLELISKNSFPGRIVLLKVLKRRLKNDFMDVNHENEFIGEGMI